tara:strand:- start:16 stop:465 length:450 start_codon:yes stop_codon:yes gene_type:complete
VSSISKDIKKWVMRITTPKDGYQICPYARKAKYKIFEHEDKLSIQQKAVFWTNEYDLILCRPTDTLMTVDHAKYIEESCNRLADYTITLLDHPDDPGYIDGEYTGNGKHILFLIQSKKDLQDARKHLRSTTYYDRWTNEYYKEVVGEEK